ncbi:DUF3152 domain-containing protein [Actinoplanes sp. NPDC049265]|uniref:DUF3152 domain-containing protein n=1 Tax=Actinoplanes sp. NPDC049265 TaxID=3363902 RepID=UPI00371D2D9B
MTIIRRHAAPDRRWVLAVPLIVLIVVAIAGLIRQRAAAPPVPPSALSESAPVVRPTSAPRGFVRTDPIRMAGPVPTRGGGKFDYAAGRGRVLGYTGPVRRFRVAVERGGTEDVRAFAAAVEKTLGDPRSWIGNRELRLQRVGGAEAADFTIFLATRDTAAALCSSGGLDIRAGRTPYTSCRTTGRVIINLDRWWLSAAPYVVAKVPLATYRQYVINHEVGHELGEGHQACPAPGAAAPVMVQQTLSLDGCVPYAWPRRANRPYAGRRL